MSKQIKFDIMFSPYTIDTYQTFNLDSETEYIYESENCDYDSIEWDCDMLGYIQSLANSWAELMNNNIVDDVILSVKLDGKPWSPKEYNHSTDNCNNIFTVNYNNLKAYIKANQSDFNKNHIRSRDGFMCFMSKNEIMLHYYLHNESVKLYSEDDYISDQISNNDAYEFIEYKVIKVTT